MWKVAGGVMLLTTLAAAGSQQPTFKARADLVQVDVVVVDAKGNPIRGLKTSDFALRDRGKSQEIATFDEVAIARPRQAVPADPRVRRDVSNNQTALVDRLVVLVVDDLHIYKDRTARAKDIAARVLVDLGAGASMAVLFTSGDHSTQITDDQAVLRDAVDTLKGRQSWRRPHPATDAMTGSRIDPEDSMDAALAKLQEKQDASAQDFFENIKQYKVMRDAARLLETADRRRKAFVLISEGIGKDLTGLFGAMAPAGAPPEGGSQYAAGNLAALNIVAPATYHDFAVIDMMEALRRANVATYAIDPRGKVATGDLA